MNSKISSLLVLVLVVSTNLAYGQQLNTTQQEQQTEPRTFENCFINVMKLFTLITFDDNDNLTLTDLTDPAYKKVATNMCNFYHEKTGIWIDINSEDVLLTMPWTQEFNDKYFDTLPEKLKEKYRQDQNQSRELIK